MCAGVYSKMKLRNYKMNYLTSANDILGAKLEMYYTPDFFYALEPDCFSETNIILSVNNNNILDMKKNSSALLALHKVHEIRIEMLMN